jgi:acetyl esterase/lipase
MELKPSGVEGLQSATDELIQLAQYRLEHLRVAVFPFEEEIPDAISKTLQTLQKLKENLADLNERLTMHSLSVKLHREIGIWVPNEGVEDFGCGVPGCNIRAIGFLLTFVRDRVILLTRVFSINPFETEAAKLHNIKRWRPRDISLMHTEEHKLLLLIRFFPEAINYPIDEYLMSRESRIDGVETLVCCDDEKSEQILKKQYDRFFSNLAVANGFVEFGWKYSGIKSKLMMVFGAVYFGLRQIKARERFHYLGVGKSDIDVLDAKKALDGDSVKFVKYLWDLPESGMFRKIFQLSFPKIHRQKLFHITGEDGHLIPVRFLASKHIDPGCDSIILHLHGGGFICQTSFSHQNYTRQWARDQDVNAPVLSVDYRLAPDYRYPIPLNDCLSVYKWLVENHDEVYSRIGLRFSKIVIAGDSAGGNLAAAIAVHCILNKYRKPDGLLLAYPALQIAIRFSPSNLMSQKDRLVPVRFLINCALSYIPDPYNMDDTLRDPCLCPAVSSDDVLGEFPTTRILVGDQDPLADESVRLAYRLNCLKRNVKIKVYKGLGHGFLSFDSPRKCFDFWFFLYCFLTEL